MFSIQTLVRPHILTLKPYSSARDEYTGAEGIFLDANENPLGSALENESFNRYPDPYQRKVKEKLAVIKNCSPAQIFLGNGSDEPIDLLFRAFCEPKQDNVILMPPTYGMYEVSADLNLVTAKKVNLTPDFQIDIDAVLKAIDRNTKLIFVCSPNNPTANSLKKVHIRLLLSNFGGLVIVDEAYIDFAKDGSWIEELSDFPNLVVLQTFSKAWGLAALRLGMAFASEEIIQILNKIKPPYNINEATQQLALQALDHVERKDTMVKTILAEREKLVANLVKTPCIVRVYPSDANFVLVKTTNAKGIYDYLVAQKIIVRDRSKVVLCEDSLRITVGTAEENAKLLEQLRQYEG
ncbi:histidinol-phosphate transaminase [Thermoflexibacter ruber]|uniref:Histidinol-phosphate aminotransferase n=1 Tax=Thermoflexibacter ruber TaxID=1003 RepID=A0A1I2BLP2_9BACT|nr:histidinol-phosphate transaminase [Thermoflexibacter ruber]SFE57075.1 histidinol phosphate aminotransferase apoenzyme [Thermoflexibacter ruber]